MEQHSFKSKFLRSILFCFLISHCQNDISREKTQVKKKLSSVNIFNIEGQRRYFSSYEHPQPPLILFFSFFLLIKNPFLIRSFEKKKPPDTFHKICTSYSTKFYSYLKYVIFTASALTDGFPTTITTSFTTTKSKGRPFTTPSDKLPGRGSSFTKCTLAEANCQNIRERAHENYDARPSPQHTTDGVVSTEFETALR